MNEIKTDEQLRGVLGIVERKGKYLFGLESKDSAIKGKWRLLGGKLEQGENSMQALRRELIEEAGINVIVQKYLGNIKGTMNDIAIDVYAATYFFGRLKPKKDELARVGWFDREQIKALDVEDLSRQLFESYLDSRERESRRPEPCYRDYGGCDAGAIC